MTLQCTKRELGVFQELQKTSPEKTLASSIQLYNEANIILSRLIRMGVKPNLQDIMNSLPIYKNITYCYDSFTKITNEEEEKKIIISKIFESKYVKTSIANKKPKHCAVTIKTTKKDQTYFCFLIAELKSEQIFTEMYGTLSGYDIFSMKYEEILLLFNKVREHINLHPYHFNKEYIECLKLEDEKEFKKFLQEEEGYKITLKKNNASIDQIAVFITIYGNNLAIKSNYSHNVVTLLSGRGEHSDTQEKPKSTGHVYPKIFVEEAIKKTPFVIPEKTGAIHSRKQQEMPIAHHVGVLESPHKQQPSQQENPQPRRVLNIPEKTGAIAERPLPRMPAPEKPRIPPQLTEAEIESAIVSIMKYPRLDPDDLVALHHKEEDISENDVKELLQGKLDPSMKVIFLMITTRTTRDSIIEEISEKLKGVDIEDPSYALSVKRSADGEKAELVFAIGRTGTDSCLSFELEKAFNDFRRMNGSAPANQHVSIRKFAHGGTSNMALIRELIPINEEQRMVLSKLGDVESSDSIVMKLEGISRADVVDAIIDRIQNDLTQKVLATQKFNQFGCSILMSEEDGKTVFYVGIYLVKQCLQ